MEDLNKIRQNIKGKRLLSVDFGMKRIGTAISDEFHITISPQKVFLKEEKGFPENFLGFLKKENIGVMIIGIPVHKDNEESELLKEIHNFIELIKEKTGLLVFETDESYTSVEAVKIMVDIGTKKKKRGTKGSKDLVSAALILRRFLEEVENYPRGL